MGRFKTIIPIVIFLLLFSSVMLSRAYGDGLISGTVSYTGTQTGTIYVAAFTSPISCSSPITGGPPYYIELPTLGSYTLSGLPDGTYYVASIIMTCGTDCGVGPMDPWGIYNGCSSITPVVISGGNAILGINITLVDGTASDPNPFYEKYSPQVFSGHWSSSGYFAEINVADPNKDATSVTATGPGISGTMNLVFKSGDGLSSPMWWHTYNPFLGTSKPQSPQTFTITITDATGTYTYQRTITGYVEEFATNLSPVGHVSGTITFSWTGIANADDYAVELSDSNNNRIWNAYHIPSATTSIVYSGPALTPGHLYQYDVVSGVKTNDVRNISLAKGWFVFWDPNQGMPKDPNDKTGPSGYGAQGFIPVNQTLRYLISFENLKTASAPAQEVVITDHLDITKLDPDTFSFEVISFGNHEIIVPENNKIFNTTVDLRPEKNLLVIIQAEFDPNIGLLTWHLKSVDPFTGELPGDPMVGFLPPNASPPEGQGYVTFRIKPKTDIASGTEIRNKASIIFNNELPVETSEVLNTIDSGIPISSVSPLSSTQTTADFTVSWSGSDDIGGSGIKNYDIYVSDNSSPYTLWTTTSETSAIFTGEPGHQYSFYSRARDNAGNIENAPAQADATTTVAIPAGLLGDMNGDDIIDISDVILELRIALKIDPVQPCSDINNDGVVDISDVILTLRMALGLDQLRQCS